MSDASKAQRMCESVFYVNGDTVEGAPVLLETLLTRYHLSLASHGIAVALNERVVPRSTWAECTVSPQDRVEIVRAFQGG